MCTLSRLSVGACLIECTLYSKIKTTQAARESMVHTDWRLQLTAATPHRCQPLQKRAEKIAFDLDSVMRMPRLTSIPVSRLPAAASACPPSCTACSACSLLFSSAHGSAAHTVNRHRVIAQSEKHRTHSFMRALIAITRCWTVRLGDHMQC